MLSKFFKKVPRAGQPASLQGLADGLAKMDNAWATLDVLGGYVDWAFGRPTIVPNGSSGTFGSAAKLFDVRYSSDGKIQIYGEDNEDAVVVNGGDVRKYPANASVELGWTDYATTDSFDAIIYVRMMVNPTAPAESIDTVDCITNAYNRWEYNATPRYWGDAYTSYWQDRTAVPIAYVKIVGGAVVTLQQLHVGAIKFSFEAGDADVVTDIGAFGSIFNQSSIERNASVGSSHNGAFQLYQFDAPTAPDDVTLTSVLVRQVNEGVTQLRYVAWSSLLTDIGGSVGSSLLHNSLDGLQGGNAYDDGPPEIEEAYYHLTLAQWLLLGGSDPAPVVVSNHAELADLVAGAGTDDHIDESRGGAVDSLNVSYLNLDGDEERNRMSTGSAIGDDGALASLSPDLRIGYDATGAVPSLDWNTQQAAISTFELTQGTLTDSTTGTVGTGELEATTDTSESDQSVTINNNFAILIDRLNAARSDISDLRTMVGELKSALEAYKIIATPE